MKRIVIPDTWLGEPIEGAIDKVLEIPKKKNRKTEARKITPVNISEPQNWLILEGRQHGNYSYGDLIVCMHRLGCDSAVEKAARDLGFEVSNTGEEKDKTPYIGNITWEQALKLNLKLGNVTLTPRQGLDLILDLQQGIRAKKKIYCGNGKEVKRKKIEEVYNEIWQAREPWRGVWLDAKFEKRGEKMHILYGHSLDAKGNLVCAHNEILESCLAENTQASLLSGNKQGMPTKKSMKGNFYFWAPLDEHVARFVADSGGAGLVCGGGPSFAGPLLGVFPCAEGTAKKN